MSEVRYRGQLRQMLAVQRFSSDYLAFMEAILESTLFIPVQLRLVLKSDEQDMMSHAVRLGRELKIHEIAPDLIHAYTAVVNNFPLQKRIFEVIAYHIKHENIYQFLLDKIQDTQLNRNLRIQAIIALARGKTDVIALLLGIAHDATEEASVRGNAIKALTHQIADDEFLIREILSFLKDDSSIVRWYALQSISMVGDHLLASYVEPLLTDTTPGGIAPTLGAYARQVLEKWASTKAEKPDNSV